MVSMQRFALLKFLPQALLLPALLLTESLAAAQQQPTRVLSGKIAFPAGMSAAEQAMLMEAMAQEGISLGPGGAVTSAPVEGEEGEEGEEKPMDPQLLQLFQQAILDRRPSTMLTEWSKTEPLPSDEDPELKDPEEPEKIEDAPEALVLPVEPEKPADLVEPTMPEAPAKEVSGLGGLIELAQAKAEAAEAFDVTVKAYEEKLAAFETATAGYETAKAAYDEAKPAYDETKKAYDKKKKAYDKEVAKWNAEKAKKKQARMKRDVEIYRRSVTLGRWDAVGETLLSFGKAQAKVQYGQLLSKISRSPQPQQGQMAAYDEEPHFEFDDIVAVIKIAPEGFDDKKANLIAPLVRRVFAQGHSLDDWLERLREEIARPEEELVISKRLSALLLTAQKYNLELDEFLPTFEEAVAEDDREALNLLARHHMARYGEKNKPEILLEAWEATLAVLAPGAIDEKDNKKNKAEALKRAVDLAQRVQDEKGETWLRETFSDRPQRGMEIIATIGSEASTNMVKNANNTAARISDMELLCGAIGALLEIAPERADEWSETLSLTADIWLREAEHSFKNAQQTSMGPRSQRDNYGNIFWSNNSYYDYGRSYMPVKPIEPSDLLENRPDGLWRDALPASLRPKIDQTIAQLYLKVSEEIQAFPYIKDLAAREPKKANELAKTFLEVWITNNDPNASRNRSSIYNFNYGYNTRASGIPLTRSKQDRNLKDLSEWVAKLREVEGLELDSDLLMRAFTQCHSQAEVYRVEILEQVFGDLETLDAKTLASMTQKMRANLATIWRQPDVQKAASTNRKQKDIQAEVERGYEIAQQLLARSLVAHPDSWRLHVVRGAMLHDLNNYKNDLKKSSGFSGSRSEALEVLASGAETYVAAIAEMQTNEYSVNAFSTWFTAAMGASDLPAVTEKTLLARHEIPKIKEMLDGIEGEAGEKHRSMFANMLFTRLSSVNPAVKNRYLEAGFDIVGDHPQAKAARRVYDYYSDLVTEIELLAELDGDSDVGENPFGLRIDLRYTKEIGRESGGFARYLQNQANAVNYYYNYGRPQENYRDKFEEAVRTLLSEQFDVMSITFNREDAASKADAVFGWRRMSYAYVLLKAKGPEVDRIPPLKLDLDFNDVTGYVVLPITSPVVPIDSSVEGTERPFKNVQLTQTLDERRADEGILTVEVKALAEGIVPAFDQLVQMDSKDFKVKKVDDQGVSVARFADDEEGVVSERLWLVELEPKEGVDKPEDFAFAEPKIEDTKAVYQRLDDADLMAVEPIVKLGQDYSAESKFDWRWLLLIPALLAMLFMLRVALKGEPTAAVATGPRMPDEITPVTVLGLLGDLRSSPKMDDSSRQGLDSAVLEIEAHYFGEKTGSAPDLTGIARDWLGRLRP